VAWVGCMLPCCYLPTWDRKLIRIQELILDTVHLRAEVSAEVVYHEGRQRRVSHLRNSAALLIERTAEFEKAELCATRSLSFSGDSLREIADSHKNANLRQPAYNFFFSFSIRS
jgi:hypothetical protein